jgi:hypothetical protein
MLLLAHSEIGTEHFNEVARLGKAGAASSSEGTGWANAMDFGRQTQRLGNLGTEGGQRVPAPKDVRGTSVMPSRAPKYNADESGHGALRKPQRQHHSDE